MTMREVVDALRREGYQVDYYIRRDGSIRITSILGNGLDAKFKPNQSLGNTQARNLANAGLSKIALQQRQSARTGEFNPLALKNQPIEFQRAFKKMQKDVQKANRRAQRQGREGVGNITWEKTAAGYFRFGAEHTMEHLDNILQMANDYAPNNFVDTFIGDLRAATDLHEEFRLHDPTILDWVLDHRRELPAEGVRKAIGAIYEMDAGLSNPAETALEVMKLIGM